MEWDAIRHDDERYLEIITRGVADEDGSLAMAKAIAELMREARFTRVLIDHRSLSGVKGTILAVYERPKLFRLIGVLLGIRIAEIVQVRHREHFRFLETVCLNRGYKLGIFHEKSAALAWLLGPAVAKPGP